MIELSDDLIFAEGGRRYCFVHPDDPGKCIKTLSPNGDPKKRRTSAPWYKKLRPLSMFDDNHRELKSFNELAKKGEAVWAHFPRCYGIQETSRGPGIVTDLIRDGSGAISKTVRQYVAAYGKTPELLAALEDFFNFLRKNNVITRDVLDHNLVVQSVHSPKCSTGGQNDNESSVPKTENLKPNTLIIYMIDGFGSSEIVPASVFLPMLGRKKIERKTARFIGRYAFDFEHGGAPE